MFARWRVLLIMTGFLGLMVGCATTVPDRYSPEKANVVKSKPEVETAVRQNESVKRSDGIERATAREPDKSASNAVDAPNAGSGLETVVHAGNDVKRPALLEETIVNKPVRNLPEKVEAPRVEAGPKTAVQESGDEKRAEETERVVVSKPVSGRTAQIDVARRDPDAEAATAQAGIEKIRERLKLAAAAEPEADRHGKMRDIKTIKIKVLSGGDNLSAARMMAKKLTGLGYNCNVIDKAPRSKFDVTTIYFAANYEKEAKRLAAQLGEKIVFKPLTWSSAFHMIVATGR